MPFSGVPGSAVPGELEPGLGPTPPKVTRIDADVATGSAEGGRVTQLTADVATTKPGVARVSQISVDVATPVVVLVPPAVTRIDADVATWRQGEARVSQVSVDVATRNIVDPCATPPDEQDVSLDTGPRLFVTWDPGDGLTAYSEHDLNDAPAYFGGLKRAKLISVSPIRRSLTGWDADYEVGQFRVTLADPDNTIRAIFAAAPGKYFPGREVAVYLTTDAGRAAQAQPRLMGWGLVDGDPEFGDDGSVTLPCVDMVGALIFGWGNKDKTYPTRLVAPPEFPDAREAVKDCAVPFPYGVITDAGETLPPTVPPAPTNFRCTDIVNPTNRPLANRWYFITQANSLGESPVVGPLLVRSPETLDEDHYVKLEWDGDGTKYAAVIYGRYNQNFANSSVYWLDTECPWNPGGVGRYHYDKNDLTKNKTSAYWIAKKQSEFPPAVGEGSTTDEGVFEPIYTRDVTLSGTSYVELLVAGCAIEDITNVYWHENGAFTELSLDDADFVIPGTAAWIALFGVENFLDVAGSDGRVYRRTPIYVKGQKADQIRAHYGMEGITLPEGVYEGFVKINLRGIEDIGNGTGEVYTDLHDQAWHFLNFVMLANDGEGYLTGDWAAQIPMFPGTSICMVNRPSFRTVKTQRQGELAGGYPGGWWAGGWDGPADGRTWIERLCTSGCFRIGQNHRWQLMAWALDVNKLRSGLPHVRDPFMVHRTTGDPQPQSDALANVFDYRWKHPLGSEEWGGTGTKKDFDSIASYRREVPGRDIDLYCLRDDTAAAHVVDQTMVTTRVIPILHSPEGTLKLDKLFDLGSEFLYSHYRGLAAAPGLTDRLHVVLGMAYNPESRRVTVEAWDLNDIVPLPAVLSITPALGLETGGETAIISGTGFSPDCTVTLGGAAATVVHATSTEIEITTPAHTPGAVDVVVLNPSGSFASLPAGYEYIAVLSFISVDPASGPIAGGTPVTITGTGFRADAMTVTFGGEAATSIVVVSSTSITCETPAHAVGAVDIVLTRSVPSATVTGSGAYMYEAAADWVLFWDDDFEAGLPTADHYEPDIEGSSPVTDWVNTVGGGNSASRGLVHASPHWNNFDPKLSEMTNTGAPTGGPRVAPGIDYLNPYRYGKAQFDTNLTTPTNNIPLFTCEINWGTGYDYLFYLKWMTGGVLRVFSPNYIYGQLSYADSAAGAVTLSTWQTITVEWCLSTLTVDNSALNSDGYVAVSVNAVEVVRYTGGVSNDICFAGYDLEGNNCWNQCWFQPEGRIDNIKIWKK